MPFQDKVAFVTGGAAGFGRAFGRALAAEGAAIVIADIDSDAAAVTAEELTAEGHTAFPVACDVADESQVDRAVAAAADEFGRIDVLINNAGKHLTKYNQPFTVLSRAELRMLFDVNVIGVVNCCVACHKTMRDQGGGAILNIASIGGHLSTSPYGVSKLTVRGLTIAFASEFAEDGIRVNAISPGLMATENAMGDLPDDLVEDFVHNRQLVRRLGSVDDVISAMLFLCSEDSSFVTGETVKISGGYPLAL